MFLCTEHIIKEGAKLFALEFSKQYVQTFFFQGMIQGIIGSWYELEMWWIIHSLAKRGQSVNKSLPDSHTKWLN